MPVLVLADHSEGKFKNTAFELISYGKSIAKMANTKLIVATICATDISGLSGFGPDKVINIVNDRLSVFNARAIADALSQLAEKESAEIIVLDSSNNSKYLAPLLAVNLNAGMVSGVTEVPASLNPLVVKRVAFSSKAFVHTEIKSDNKIICLAKNSFGIKEEKSSPATEEFTASLTDDDFKITLKSVEKTSGKITIADADIVVSGGRGLKGPENWGMVERLAEVLGAATACSKPVSDLHWRPHSEHVGQTGKPVAANLYIAIGISGAIQHLAGVNASKCKVVINTDPEAPFFKAADYGIVGDAFEVVPKLTEKLKDFKRAQ
jgi:electron transfer flavoprotein alpha subunit